MSPHDESLLQDLLDDRLDASEAAAVRARLDAEPDLAETWQELRRIRDLVRGAPADRAPPDFLSRVRARIAAAEDSGAAGAASTAPGADAPAGRLLAFPRQLAVAASGLAALFLVALGVRWIVARSTPPVLETQELESAEAPARSAPTWGLLDEREDGEAEGSVAGGAPPPGVRAPAEPAATRSTPAPVAATPHAPAAPLPVAPPRGRPRGFGPGDQVPPNLRIPSDERTVPEAKGDAETLARLEEARRGAGRDKTADALRPEAALTWSLEAEDLASGRARLALLVGALPTGEADAYGATPLRPGRDDDRILGSVLLVLSEAEAAALAPATAAARHGPPETDPDDAPEAGESVKKGEGQDAGTEPTVTRVRILLVRRRDGR